MKKNNWIFIAFIVVVLGFIGYGIFYVFGNVSGESYIFNKDGYALYVKENNNYKAESYTFTNGSTYNYKKSRGKITFDSSNNGNVSIDDSTMVHYTDNSLLVLKNVVALDLSTIKNDIIFYYNVYKNTNINYESGSYSITSVSGETVRFKNLLVRINDNKYLLVSDNVRVAVGKDEVIDYGKYVYIEYTDGKVVALYNNTKTHQSISEDLSIVTGDITINLGDKSISKEGKKYITLSNLVINSDGNIDLVVDESKSPVINKPNVENNNNNEDKENGVAGGVTEDEGNMNEEVVEDENKIVKQPIYKIVNMEVSAINIDAEIEIQDEDSLIISATDITIVDNASLKVVYESSVPAGDTSAFISCAGLSPDTEYTIYAKSTFDIDGYEYTKSFVNKIFRTEALGVTFQKSYATNNSIAVKVDKKEYSEVTSVVISVYDEAGVKLNYKAVDFVEKNTVEVIFEGLTKNTKYNVVMSEVLCNGVVVEEGYFEEKQMLTLKEAPSVGNLQFEINKRTSKFELSINGVKDPDYGIVGYRYEIFDVRQNMEKDTPILVVETNKLEKVSINVDEVKLLRGSTYTYRVAVIFEDNDKTTEYIKELGGTMQMDGVAFPTVRFDADLVTWEQINGTIIIEDPNHTIVGDTYKVVYKNAADVYTTDTIISSSSEETVPIAVNNLRSNETYTFQVYASVNLKDGNPTIEQAYIGSVIVKTGFPESLTVNYEAKMNYSSAFSVEMQLADDNGKSASLEASTISEMTLTLYQGSTATGAIEVYRKVVDSNTDDYISTIKEGFYDTKAVIDPSFFNSINNDFTEKTYTLVISDVRDYTKYKNEIPVTNNTFTFNVNNFLPDLPGANANPVNVTKIANKNAAVFGLDYDANLEPNTVVGYSVISNFMNESQNAKRMIYHAWAYNQLTGSYEIVKDYEVAYDEFGNIDNIIVPVGYGTSNSVFDDDMLRRGNEYYFSYEVYLDIDGDGEEDTVYPTAIDKDVVLKSASQFAEKQVPSYQIYPSSSTTDSATWKYIIKDVDNCLETNKLFAFIGNDTNSTSSPTITPNQTEYASVKFTGLTNDTFYAIKGYERKIKKRTPAYTSLTTQYLSPLTSSLDLSYEVEVNSNTLIIRIEDYVNKMDLVDLIASMDIKISPTDPASTVPSRTIAGVVLDNGSAYLNLFELSEFLNTEFVVEADIYFDSGNTGFDVPSVYKAMQIVTIDGTGAYLSLEKNKLTQNSIVTGSELSIDFDPLSLLIDISDKKSNNILLPITIGSRGVILEKNNVTLKELAKQTLSSTNNTATFDLLVPNISLKDNKNVINIASLLTKVEFKADLTILDGIVIKDDKIYIDLFETDVNGTNAELKGTFIKNVSDFESTIVIEDLTPQSNYYFNFYTYIYNSYTSEYDKYYLYDEDEKSLGVNYKFHTLSDVGIDDIDIDFVIESYATKNIKLNYTLDSIYGYDFIEYKLYEKVDEEFTLVDINIPKSKVFFENMTNTISAAPGNEQGITFGKTYKIVIRPVGSYTLNGKTKEIDLGTKEKEFTIPKYAEPYVGISSGKSGDSIFFRVSIDDASRVIYNDVYTVKLIDSNYNVVQVINDNSTRTINKRFEFTATDHDLKENEVYTFVVQFDVDYANDNESFTTVSDSRQIKFGNTVNIGSLTASLSTDVESSLDIIFSDSYLLTSINKITYTVSSTTVSYFATGTTAFDLTYKPNGNIYIYKMKLDENSSLVAGNVYTITMNFYTGDSLVEQAEISYYYGG